MRKPVTSINLRFVVDFHSQTPKKGHKEVTW